MIIREIASLVLVACSLFWVGYEAIKPDTVTVTQRLANGTTVSCAVPVDEVDQSTTCVGGE